MEKVEPQKEHRWLLKLVGEWTYESEGMGAPGEPPHKSTGSERVRPVGELWIVGEGEMEMPGGETGTSLVTLGYDPEKKRFVGTWLGSMMANLWIYEGALDAAEKVLTLECDGPSFAGNGKMAKYRDAIEVKSDDDRVLTSHVLGDDGKWQQFMTMNYRRKK